MANRLELRELRQRAIVADMPPQNAIPDYWIADAPPGCARFGEWREARPDFAMSEGEAEGHLRALLNETVEMPNGCVVPVLNFVTSEPWADSYEHRGQAYPGARTRFKPEETTFGSDRDDRRPAYFRLEKIVRIEKSEHDVIVEWGRDGWAMGTGDNPEIDGMLEKVRAVAFTAYSAPHPWFDGRKDHVDWCRSDAERFHRRADGTVECFGAATALLARLLEAVTI